MRANSVVVSLCEKKNTPRWKGNTLAKTKPNSATPVLDLLNNDHFATVDEQRLDFVVQLPTFLLHISSSRPGFTIGGLFNLNLNTFVTVCSPEKNFL